MEYKILAGITKENELYFIESDNENYFSMSGFTVEPLEIEKAKDMSRESIKMLIADETRDINTLYLRDINEIVEDIIDTDGNLSGIDHSLFDTIIDVEDEEYIFLSGSCGQHKEKELKHYFIDKTEFHVLMSMWDKYHRKDVNIDKDFSLIEKQVYSKMFELGHFIDSKQFQNIEQLVTEAILIINNY